jgi:polygalacturonase
MSPSSTARRRLLLAGVTAPLLPGCAGLAGNANGAGASRVSIIDHGAVADDATVNTRAIQAAIEHLAGVGGGTLVVPAGVFVNGALFLKPGVHLHLEQGAVLKCSTDLSHFPVRRTRIEGQFKDDFNPGLINADGCDGLRITGTGTLDGAGRPIWDLFWKLRGQAKDPGNFPNLGVARARLAIIERSRGVLIEGVTFKDSQFWNLHLYKCQDVQVRQVRIQVPDDYKQAPSSDGIDLDSCQKVTIDGCHFSVTDDCIAAKGSKGPHALLDKDSPPVEQIRIRNCVFRRGHAVLTLGSEATVVRDVVIENCTVGKVDRVAHLKLRADTPQHYEDIHFRNLTLDAPGHGVIVAISPWSQYTDFKGEAPPRSTVRNISFEGIRGRFGGFGSIRPNPGQTSIGAILLKDVDVMLDKEELSVDRSVNVRFENVTVNGKPVPS